VSATNRLKHHADDYTPNSSEKLNRRFGFHATSTEPFPGYINTTSNHSLISIVSNEEKNNMSDNIHHQQGDKQGFFKKLMHKFDKGATKTQIDDQTEDDLFENDDLIDQRFEDTGDGIEQDLANLSVGNYEDGGAEEEVAADATGALNNKDKKKRKKKKSKKSKKSKGKETEQVVEAVEEPAEELTFQQRSELRQAAHKKRREDAARAAYIARHGGIVAQGRAELIDIGSDGRRSTAGSTSVSGASSTVARVGITHGSDNAGASVADTASSAVASSAPDSDSDDAASDDSADTLTKIARMGIVVPKPSAEEMRRRWSLAMRRILICVARFDLIGERLTQLEKDAHAPGITKTQLRDVSACVSRLTTETADQGARALGALHMSQCYDDMHEEVNEMIAKKHDLVRRLMALSDELRARIIAGDGEEDKTNEDGDA
jgi:hypothetical protein